MRCVVLIFACACFFAVMMKKVKVEIVFATRELAILRRDLARRLASRGRPGAFRAKNRGNRHYRRCQLRRPDWGNSPSEPELSFAVCLQRRPGAKEHGIYNCFLIKKGTKSGICQCRYFCVIIIFSHARFLFFVHLPGIGGTKIGRAELRPLNLGKEGETDTTHTIFGGWAEEVGRPGSNF